MVCHHQAVSDQLTTTIHAPFDACTVSALLLQSELGTVVYHDRSDMPHNQRRNVIVHSLTIHAGRHPSATQSSMHHVATIDVTLNVQYTADIVRRRILRNCHV